MWIKLRKLKDSDVVKPDPFYVDHCGFVNADEIKVGDELSDSDGSIIIDL